MGEDRLARQLQFILEIDKLKGILRRSYLLDQSRYENSAEHCWHLAIMAMLLAEHANEPVVLSRVIEMVLVHDIVELDAGDVYIYDEAGAAGKAEREKQAADRIFGMLPQDQTQWLQERWEEFEAASTPEARFAAALDRMMPLIHNYYTRGKSWQEHGITSDRVMARNSHIQQGSQLLWQEAKRLIDDAVAQGFLKPPSTGKISD
jgi:putative hydrolase of HD superfamily